MPKPIKIKTSNSALYHNLLTNKIRKWNVKTTEVLTIERIQTIQVKKRVSTITRIWSFTLNLMSWKSKSTLYTAIKQLHKPNHKLIIKMRV